MMHKRYLFTLAALLTLSTAAAAEPVTGNYKDTVGFGLGAIVGGALGGPIGAIAGAAGGAWLGTRESERDHERQQLEQSLAHRSARLQTLQNRIAELEQAQALQTVRLNESPRLAEALHLAVYFRTDSARLEPAVSGRLEKLARLLEDYPDIRVHLSGHADRRGDAIYNRELSRRRAEAVRTALTQAGLTAERIHIAVYGQSQARAAAGDIEAYIFDRRVSIELNPMDPV